MKSTGFSQLKARDAQEAREAPEARDATEAREATVHK